jgi:hypothetical protein
LNEDGVVVSAPSWVIQKLRWSLRRRASKGRSSSSWGEVVRRRDSSEVSTAKQRKLKTWSICFLEPSLEDDGVVYRGRKRVIPKRKL